MSFKVSAIFKCQIHHSPLCLLQQSHLNGHSCPHDPAQQSVGAGQYAGVNISVSPVNIILTLLLFYYFRFRGDAS